MEKVKYIEKKLTKIGFERGGFMKNAIKLEDISGYEKLEEHFTEKEEIDTINKMLLFEIPDINYSTDSVNIEIYLSRNLVKIVTKEAPKEVSENVSVIRMNDFKSYSISDFYDIIKGRINSIDSLLSVIVFV